MGSVAYPWSTGNLVNMETPTHNPIGVPFTGSRAKDQTWTVLAITWVRLPPENKLALTKRSVFGPLRSVSWSHPKHGDAGHLAPPGGPQSLVRVEKSASVV